MLEANNEATKRSLPSGHLVLIEEGTENSVPVSGSVSSWTAWKRFLS